MIEYNLDTAHSILLVHPKSALDKSDFAELTTVVDPQIEKTGELAGLIIDAPEFPGWDNFGTMVTHFRFVRDHHKHVKKVRSSPTRTSGMSPSVSRRTLCPPRFGIFPVSNSSKRNSGLSMAPTAARPCK